MTRSTTTADLCRPLGTGMLRKEGAPTLLATIWTLAAMIVAARGTMSRTANIGLAAVTVVTVVTAANSEFLVSLVYFVSFFMLYISCWYILIWLIYLSEYVFLYLFRGFFSLLLSFSLFRRYEVENKGNNLFVSGLAPRTRDEDLEKEFGKFGKVFTWI